jgi:hypothetical protein
MGRRPAISGPARPLQSNRRRRILHEELHAAAASLPPQDSAAGTHTPQLPRALAIHHRRRRFPRARGSTRVGTSPPRSIRRRREGGGDIFSWAELSRRREAVQDGVQPPQARPRILLLVFAPHQARSIHVITRNYLISACTRFYRSAVSIRETNQLNLRSRLWFLAPSFTWM